MNYPVTEIELTIPIEHDSFPDHFPGAPLVPGALLLKWILKSLSENQAVQVHYIKQVKFLAPVKPGDRVKLNVIRSKNVQLAIDAYVDEIPVLKGLFEGVLL